jgi:hypothetical protein
MTVPTANTAPIWSAAPTTGTVAIGQASTNVNTSAPGAIGTNCFLAFSTGTDGAFIQKVRFTFSSTTSAINSVATKLQIYLSTVSSGSPTAAEATLLIDVQAAAQTLNTTTAPYIIEVPLNVGIQASRHILVAQSIAQSANANWNAMVFAGNY